MKEQRRFPRIPVTIPVQLAAPGGPRVPAVCRDLSLGGIHVDAELTATFGSPVDIYLPLEGMASDKALPGVVRWTKGSQIGIQFGLLGARETHAITQALSQLGS